MLWMGGRCCCGWVEMLMWMGGICCGWVGDVDVDG